MDGLTALFAACGGGIGLFGFRHNWYNNSFLSGASRKTTKPPEKRFPAVARRHVWFLLYMYPASIFPAGADEIQIIMGSISYLQAKCKFNHTTGCDSRCHAGRG
jgi:hypothetical protein